MLEMTDNELIFKKHQSSVEWAADHLGTGFISQDFFSPLLHYPHLL